MAVDTSNLLSKNATLKSIGGAMPVIEQASGPSNYGEGGTFTATTGAEANSGGVVSSAKYVDVVAFIVDGSPGVININVGSAVTADANDYPIAMNQTYRFPFTSGDTISAWNPVASGQSVLVYYHPVG